LANYAADNLGEQTHEGSKVAEICGQENT
jgi:hypothetical protein